MRCQLLALFSFLSLAAVCHAGTESKEIAPSCPIQEPLAKGTMEVELLGGYFHSPINTGFHRPEFDYAGADARFGMVATSTLFSGCPVLRGNLELLVDALGNGVTEGPGTYLAGGSLLIRYNFLSSCHIIPYFEVGGGGLHSDAVEDESQRLIGGNFEFILSADLGVRFLLNNHWSLLLEGGFQHISNADTASRNVGVNAAGGRLGFGYIY
jgi:hypothetical protein